MQERLGDFIIFKSDLMVYWYNDRECVWYCGSCCGCNFKKVILEKVLLVEVNLEKYMCG